MLHGEICGVQYPANCARIGESPGTVEQCSGDLAIGSALRRRGASVMLHA